MSKTTVERKKAQKRKNQLGMSLGTASNQLKKIIMFDLVCRLNLNICHQCGKTITCSKDLTIDHIHPYLDSLNPKEFYFDLKNIAFSHHKCNVGARRNRPVLHGSSTMYIDYKCRCEKCLQYRKDRYAKNGT